MILRFNYMKEFIGKALGALVGFVVLLVLNVYWIEVEEALFQTVVQALCILLTIVIMSKVRSQNSAE